MELTTFVIDDDEAVRSSLTFLLRAEGITSRAYPSARAFLDQLHPDHNGCIITDIRMPEMDGLALVEALHQLGCRIPVVVITGHADVPLAVKAMKAGVAEFIEKPFDSDDILNAVRLCLDQAHRFREKDDERAGVARRLASLTERERQVLSAVIEGLSNKEVGQLLDISPRTVEIHRANMMSKMQASSLSQLVRMMLWSEAA